ncbi:hypothetical protein AB0F81_11565 [Actinoplanes sp. NPDC024001]
MSAGKLGRFVGLVFVVAAVFSGFGAVGHADASRPSAAVYATLDFTWN